jgi:tetratricopeptide (TPR) repeat protein
MIPVISVNEDAVPTDYRGRILSVIPPMTQLNTPYPSTADLTGFLRSRGFDAVQEDLALELVLRLLSRTGLQQIHEIALRHPSAKKTGVVRFFLEQFGSYLSAIDPVIRFLQGRDSTLAHRIAARTFLPEGPRFQTLEVFEGDEESGEDPLAWAFGALGVQDRARHLCTLFLSDLADVIREAIDTRFEFVRYAESLAASDRALTLDPKNAEAWYNRGNTYRITNAPDSALVCFNRAIELDASNYFYFNNRGITYRMRGDAASAIADFTRALVLEPNNLSILMNRSVCYLDTKKWSEAAADLDKILAINPNYPGARQNRNYAAIKITGQ